VKITMICIDAAPYRKSADFKDEGYIKTVTGFISFGYAGGARIRDGKATE